MLTIVIEVMKVRKWNEAIAGCFLTSNPGYAIGVFIDLPIDRMAVQPKSKY